MTLRGFLRVFKQFELKDGVIRLKPAPPVAVAAPVISPTNHPQPADPAEEERQRKARWAAMFAKSQWEARARASG